MGYSVIIKNGSIIDGTGSTAASKSDVGVKGDKIEQIGNLANADADIIIDAKGLYVAPGFIDLTTHSDRHWTLFTNPSQESFLRQGITTIVGGHGGISLAPLLKTEAREPLCRWANVSETNLNWQTLEEFFSELSKNGLCLNYATFVGYKTLRKNILGNEKRAPKISEIKIINKILEQALKEGAMGFSTNFGDIKAEEISPAETETLFGTAREYDCLTSHHLEDEGKNLLPALSKIITDLRNSGARGHIAHFKALGHTAWENFPNALKMVDFSRNDGMNLTCDFFPYGSTGSDLASFLPPWILSEGKEKILETLKDKNAVSNLKAYLKSLTLHYERIIVASASQDKNSIGKSIGEISEDCGLSEEDVLMNLLLINELQISIFSASVWEENIEMLAKKDYSAVSSDGIGYSGPEINWRDLENKKDLPHPRSFGSFPRFVKVFVKEKKVLDWEAAIHKMSGLPASILGIKQRGAIKKGNFADIVVFDPNKIEDRAEYEEPFKYSKGVNFVFVNGELVLSEDSLTGKMAGKVLKRQ